MGYLLFTVSFLFNLLSYSHFFTYVQTFLKIFSNSHLLYLKLIVSTMCQTVPLGFGVASRLEGV